MEIGHFLFAFAIILLSARLFAEIAGMIKIPAVIGELFAGVLLGPSLLNMIQPDEIWNILAEVGIVLLLFEVGMETDFYRLTRTGTKPYFVAVFGFIVPFVLAFCLCHFIFHLSVLVSLFIGGALTATSIGITVRVLNDLKQRQSHEAQIIIGAAVLDDILGVLLLALLYDFAVSRQLNWSATLQTGLYIVLFMVLAPIGVKIIMGLFEGITDKRNAPGLLLAVMISVVMLFSYFASLIGAPVIMGGFAAGLAISKQFGCKFLKNEQSPFWAFCKKLLSTNNSLTNQLEHEIKPIIQLFTPIFFVMVGVSLNLREIPWHSLFFWGLTLSLFIAAIVGKFFAGFVIKEPRGLQVIIGISMIPRGEVGLIFDQMGLVTHIFSSLEYAALILVVALTTFIPPFLLRWRYGRA